MAKKPAKETSLPLIISLVFFVITTIGLGVFCYVLYSDQQAKDDAVKAADKKVVDLRKEAKEWETVARAHRVFSGVTEGDEDLAFLRAEIKEGDKGWLEIKRLNDTAKKKVPAMQKDAVEKFFALVEDAAKKGKLDRTELETLLGTPDNFTVWDPAMDTGTKQLTAPTATMLDWTVRSTTLRGLAIRQANADRAAYKDALDTMAKAATAYDAARKTFNEKAVAIPKTLEDAIAEMAKKTDNRTKAYTDDVAAVRKDIDKLNEEKEKLTLDVKRLREQVGNLKTELTGLIETRDTKTDPFAFDEPKGKILKRYPDGTVDIDLGSNANVRQGLTFTVLPSDFPQKGRQSRVKMIRVPDGRGGYKGVERFVPKGTIEVTEVVGPNLSRGRITEEAEDIRDQIIGTDLIYNAVWRKGESDHVALVGIFDINGDGTDDIESVVRDLNRMGVTVDAYYDLRQNKWIGQITQRTRFVVEGYFPTVTPSDANREAKTKLISGLSGAISEAKAKGKSVVSYKDFFPRMGYRVKIDVSEDRINQAAARYLGTFVAPTDPANPGM